MPISSTGLTEPGIRAEFFERYNARPTVFDKVSSVLKMNTESETFRFLGAPPLPQPRGSATLATGMVSESYVLSSEEYTSAIEIPLKEIEDDQTGQIRARISELADVSASHKDSLLGALLDNGGTGLAYDGQAYFSAAHASGLSGAQSNAITFDISDEIGGGGGSAANPSVLTCQQAVQRGIAQMMGLRDEQGNPLNVMADMLAVICPVGMYFNMLSAVGAKMLNNTDNVMAQFVPEVYPLPWLTGASAFYVCKRGASVGPFVFLDRLPPSLTVFDVNSEYAKEHFEVQAKFRGRYGLRYGRWQRCVRVTLQA